jgi:hypothetical protein
MTSPQSGVRLDNLRYRVPRSGEHITNKQQKVACEIHGNNTRAAGGQNQQQQPIEPAYDDNDSIIDFYSREENYYGRNAGAPAPSVASFRSTVSSSGYRVSQPQSIASWVSSTSRPEAVDPRREISDGRPVYGRRDLEIRQRPPSKTEESPESFYRDYQVDWSYGSLRGNNDGRSFFF